MNVPSAKMSGFRFTLSNISAFLDQISSWTQTDTLTLTRFCLLNMNFCPKVFEMLSEGVSLFLGRHGEENCSIVSIHSLKNCKLFPGTLGLLLVIFHPCLVRKMHTSRLYAFLQAWWQQCRIETGIGPMTSPCFLLIMQLNKRSTPLTRWT